MWMWQVPDEKKYQQAEEEQGLGCFDHILAEHRILASCAAVADLVADSGLEQVAICRRSAEVLCPKCLFLCGGHRYQCY